MKVAIMQPTFNPWLGYFDLINYVDKFIFLDSVQLSRRSWQLRNKIKINNKEYMLSIPIKKEKSRDETILNDAKISYDNFDFREKIYNLIIQNYNKTPFFNELSQKLSEIILFDTDNLSNYNINFIVSISKLLGFDTIFENSSNIKNISGKKAELILNICINQNCSEYISPLGSKKYLNELTDKFRSKNIIITYQKYSHPRYNQLGKEFIPYLGILDLLLNEGIENSKEIILKGRCFGDY